MLKKELMTNLTLCDLGIHSNLSCCVVCDKPLIEKTRYKYDHEDLTWEIDEFHGDNDGLVVAEVELESEDQQFKKPDFISEEVTGQEKYYNMMLLKNPYPTWKK